MLNRRSIHCLKVNAPVVSSRLHIHDETLANMPVMWVQYYWTALPIIVEARDMSDRSHSGARMLPGAHHVDGSPQHRLGDRESIAQTSKSLIILFGCLGGFAFALFCADGLVAEIASGSPAYDLPQNSVETQQQYPGSRAFPAPGQHAAAHASGAFDMFNIAGALPDYATSKPPQQSHPRLPPGSLITNLGYQSQELPQFAGQIPMNHSGYSLYPIQYATPYQQAPGQSFPQPSPHQSQFGNQTSGQGSYNNNPYFINPAPQQFPYYPGQLLQSGQMHHDQDSQYASPPSRGSGHGYGQGAFDYH